MWGMLLILVGWRDLLADQHDKRYRDVVDAYGQALRIRIAASALPDAERVELTGCIDQILRSFRTSKDSFSRLLEVEQRYFRESDATGKLAEAKAIRERHARVAAPAAIESREKQGYPDLSLAWTEEMTADTVTMLNYIHARYIMNIAREEAIARQMSTLLLRFRRIAAGFVAVAAVCAMIWCVAGWFDRGPTVGPALRGFLALSVIFTVGYIGATISVSQRFQKAMEADVLQSDPVFVIGGIATGQRGIDIAMMMAGVFAILLYWLFAGGMAATLGLSGGLFPTAAGSAGCTVPDPSAASEFGRIARTLGFCGEADLFRMLIFAFAAGYAERLVPDVLNRIASAGKDRN